MKSIFDIKTIKGKVRFLLLLSIFSLMLFVVVVLIQNYKTREAIKKITNLQLPLSINSNKITNGIGQVSAAQRAFLSTGGEHYAQRRKMIWRNDIKPAYDNLQDFSKKISKDKKKNIKNIGSLLRKYEKLQTEIDSFFVYEYQELKHTLDLEDLGNLDSLELAQSSLPVLIEQIRKEKKEESITLQLANKIQYNVTPLLQKLRREIQNLNDENTILLGNEMQNVIVRLRGNNWGVIISAFLVITAIIVITYRIIVGLGKSIKKPVNIIQKLSLGEMPKDIQESEDELNDVILASKQLVENLNEASFFAQKIGDGNLDANFTPVSEQDILGNALVQMRNRLKTVSMTDQQRNWSIEGMAKFSQIIRDNNKNIQILSESIVQNIVSYLKATLAGMFLVEDKEKKLLLLASFAYNRKKFLQREININQQFGETLLGQAVLEKHSIILEDIPKDYIQIVSGAGESKPKNIAIIPIILNDKVEAVLELASLQKIEKYQIEFLEQISETIASTIVNTKNNEKTKKLLADSQEQAEELKAQEEEMRQNMEELATTQEELERRRKELEKLLQISQTKEKELKKIQFEIEEEQQNFNKMTASVPGMIFQYLKTSDGKEEFLYISEGGEELFKSSGRFLKDFSLFKQMINGEDLESFNYSLNTAIENNEVWKWEGRFNLQTKASIWISGNAQPEKQSDGSYILSGIFTNISVLKKAENKIVRTLTKAEDRAKALEENETMLKQSMETLKITQEKMKAKQEEIEQNRLEEKEKFEKKEQEFLQEIKKLKQKLS